VCGIVVLAALGSAVGDVAISIAQVNIEWLVRRIHVSPNRWLTVRAFVYIAVFILMAIAEVAALVYASARKRLGEPTPKKLKAFGVEGRE
jgi:hypothetical protein